MSATVKNEEAAEIKRYAEKLFYRYGGDLDPLIARIYMRRFISAGGDSLCKLLPVYHTAGCKNEELSQIFNLEIARLVSSGVMPRINRFIDDCDFVFLDAVSDSGSVSAEFARECIYIIFKDTLDSGTGEIVLNSSFNMLRYGIIDKYLNEIFHLKGELYRILREEMPPSFSLKESKNFIKTIIVIRPSLYQEISSLDNLNLNDDERGLIVKSVAQNFRPIPIRIIDEALKSFIPVNDPGTSGAVAGLIYIFDLLCRVSPWQGAPEPGAEPPHKSWFSIALINSEYFGFNRDILKELHSIAGERNW